MYKVLTVKPVLSNSTAENDQLIRDCIAQELRLVLCSHSLACKIAAGTTWNTVPRYSVWKHNVSSNNNYQWYLCRWHACEVKLFQQSGHTGSRLRWPRLPTIISYYWLSVTVQMEWMVSEAVTAALSQVDWHNMRTRNQSRRNVT